MRQGRPCRIRVPDLVRRPPPGLVVAFSHPDILPDRAAGAAGR